MRMGIEFGIAKIVQGRTYRVVGTPCYMAPELIMARGMDLLRIIGALAGLV